MTLLLSIFLLWHGSFSGEYSYQNRNYFYQVKADENRAGKWRLHIKTIENKESYMVYNTSIYIKENGKTIEQVKILGATQKSYLWSVLTTDFWRANFEASGKIRYEKSGKLMQKPNLVNQKDQFLSFDKSQTNETLAKKAIEQFIREYSGLFSFSDKKKVTSKNSVGKVGKFSYQFTPDFYQTDDHNIKIRNISESLVYESLVRKDEKEGKIRVRIHYSKLQNWAWAIYDSDFVDYVFDLEKQELSLQKNGGVMPSPPTTTKKLHQAKPETCLELAISYFIEDYETIFLKE